MKNPIEFTTVTISDDYTVGVEARFTDGQKYQIASIPEEHEDFAHWLSGEINAGRVPCFAGEEAKPDDRGIQIGNNNTQINTFGGTEK